MTFPTIPTVANGRLLHSTQSDTSATRTFPSLSGLTKNNGDLLVAVCIAYQTSTGTNAAFSGWTGGFAEISDSATSTTLAIGIATKTSDGTETGTFAVTQAGTITGHAAFILMSIPGADTGTPPAVGARVSGTTTAANPAALDPAAWATEDTLWIALAGLGRTSTSGTFTGITAAPANFTSFQATAITTTPSIIGNINGAVAFRQNAVASEDVATFTMDLSNTRNGAIVLAIRPGAAVSQGSAAGAVTAAGSSTGSAPRGGAATGTITAAGSSIGSTTREGASTGGVTVAGSATGGHPVPSGAATGAVTAAGTATGQAVRQGAGTGAVVAAGSSIGSRISAGAAVGSITAAGTSVGSSPRGGAATGAVTTAGSATGDVSREGSAGGDVTLAGSASGTNVLGPNAGSASGALTVTGGAAGTTTKSGSVSGGLTTTGTSMGSRTSAGVSVGAVAVAGFATGVRVAAGAASGSVVAAGSASGDAPIVEDSEGSAAGQLVIGGTAVGFANDPPTAPKLIGTGVVNVGLDGVGDELIIEKVLGGRGRVGGNL